MIQCQSCGESIAEESLFCRFCGARIPNVRPAPAASPTPQDQYAPPRPYAWKTDEYQTQAERRVRPEQPAFDRPAQPAPLAYVPGSHVAANYRCPNCGTNVLPVIERRVSTAGWITFSLLLVFTVIFFWVGLLMKESVSICPVCRTKLG